MSFGVDFAPPMGYVRFVSDDPDYRFSVRLGDGLPEVTDGYSGWSVTQRPRKRGLTEWKGNNPLTIKIPVLFDKFLQDAHGQGGQGVIVEQQIRQLEAMAGLTKTLRDEEPPLVKFHSNGVIPHDEHDATQNEWVIYGIEWGAATRNPQGNRTRQAADITVMLHVADKELTQSSAIKAKAKKKKKGSNHKSAKHKTHKVVKGETLSTIARDELDDSTRWRDIASKNPIKGKARRDPKSVKVGETLKMP
jgi:hypothetical protein